MLCNVLLIPYRRFGTTYWFHLQGSINARSPKKRWKLQITHGRNNFKNITIRSSLSPAVLHSHQAASFRHLETKRCSQLAIPVADRRNSSAAWERAMDSSVAAVCPGSPSGAAVPRTKQTPITIQKTIVYGNRPAAASSYLLHSIGIPLCYLNINNAAG